MAMTNAEADHVNDAISAFVDRRLADAGEYSYELVDALFGEPPDELLEPDAEGLEPIRERWLAGDISAAERDRLYSLAEKRWRATLAPDVRWRAAFGRFVDGAGSEAVDHAKAAMFRSLSESIQGWLEEHPAPVAVRSTADRDAEYSALIGQLPVIHFAAPAPAATSGNVVNLAEWLEASVEAATPPR